MKKATMRNFKKFLSLICSLTLVLGVSIPALTVSAAGFGEAPYAYPNPIIPSGSTTTFNFDNASEYAVANQENALYLSYYNGYGSTTVPSGTTVEITDGKLKFSSGISSGTSIQSWVINKNGAPYELIPGHSYTVTFDFVQTGTVALTSGVNGPFVSLSAGIATHDWTFKAKYGDKTYSLGAAASVMPTAGNYTYDGGLIANNARENRNIANNAVVNANINKVMHGYIGWPSAGSVKTVSYSFVAYYMNDTRVKNYLAFTFGLNAGQAFTIDNFKITDNDFVRETDTLTAENDSITYDFANADDYVLDNSGDEAYWTRYYGRPQSSYTVTDGVYSASKVIVPVENDLSIADGSLKLNPGLNDVDFSGYSTSNSAYTEPDKRSIISWVVNKNGKPIELIPGMDYTVTIKYKNYTAGYKYSFISLSNGVAKDDVNGTYWWSDFGASASVMSDSKAYTYMKAQTNPSVTGISTYPNNAAFAFDYDNAKYNHIIGMAANETVTSSTTVTKSFLAYDITENGTNAKRNNYLALTFCLCQGQTVDIEEITVTYNYAKVTNVTYDFGDGTTKSVIETVGAEFSEVATKEGYEFVGWKDEAGTVYETVPQTDGGKLTVYPAFETAPTVLEDLGQNKIEFDFTNSNEYQLVNSDAVSNKYLSYYIPATGSSTANDTTGALAYASGDLRTEVINAQEAGKTVQIVEDSENNNKKVLKLTSGLPSGAAQTTIQSWVINKNGKPIELEPGEYYDISISYRQAKSSSLGRHYTFISLSNGIDYVDVNQGRWSDFGATASVMSEKEGATYSYIVGSGNIHGETTAAYPNSAVSLWNKNYNSVMWTNADDVYSSSYTTHKNTYKAYDITEDGTENRKNYLALTFALSADQEIYIDTITITKVNKITYNTGGIDETLSHRYAACGQNITLPVAQALEDDQFIAWSTNSDGSNSLAELFTMPEDDVTLYAVYDYAEVEVYPDYYFLDSSENIKIDEDYNFSVTEGSEQAKLAISNGGGYVNYCVANDRAYKISFSYQLVGNSDAAIINAYTVKLGDTDYKEANSYALKATSSEEWQNGELIVVLNPEYYLADGQYYIANELYLGVDGIDSTATCKFANIIVTVLDEPILTVDYNLGDNKVEHNTKVELNEPEKDGYVFGGWYDSLSQEEFTATELTDDTTIYADWITEFTVGDVNHDGSCDIRDLVKLKIVSDDVDSDEISIERTKIVNNYSFDENMTMLRKILLEVVEINDIEKTSKIAGIGIDNYCVAYEDGSNVLLNDAVASLNTILGNPVANDTFKIVISNDSDKAEGIFVEGANLVVNSTDDATLISLVNNLSRTIARYNGKYHLGFNADVNYGNSNLNKSEYALVFGDEFDADSLSNSWITPNKTTEGVYADATGTEVMTYRIENNDEVLVNNGFATLTNEAVLNADGTPKYFKNQNLCSDFSFTYGYLEARVKIAASPATTALWLRGTSYSSETGFYPEFDMCETFDGDDTIKANMHAFGSDGQHYSLDHSGSEFVDDGILDWDVKDKDYECSEGRWSDDYHVFAVKWDAEGVTYYLDGKEYFTYTFDDSFLGEKSGPDTFRQPVNLVISTILGSYNYGPVWAVDDLASANVEIDYVRLYQSELDGGNLNGIIK